jgi:hypothetical protein
MYGYQSLATPHYKRPKTKSKTIDKEKSGHGAKGYQTHCLLNFHRLGLGTLNVI